VIEPAPTTPKPSLGLKMALVLVGIFTALFAAVVALFTIGDTIALVVLVAVMVAAGYGLFATRAVARSILGVMLVLGVGSVAFVGWAAFTLISAFTETEGTVLPPDPSALESARQKIDDAEFTAGFRIELTEAEMTAYLLDALADNEDNPLASVVLDVVDGKDGEQGVVRFTVEFKGGGVDGEGAVSAVLESGAVQIELEKVEVGALQVPGLAKGAIEDLIDNVADLNEALLQAGADVQALEIGGDRVLVVGTTTSTDLITSDTLLSSLRDNAAAAISAATPPPERLGPGVAGALPGPGQRSVGSAPFYVALGDSLAANVGVDAAVDGFVSRLHNQLQQRDGASYGLRNFGISGETTGTLIRAGQLDAAVEFMDANDTAYVTIDIGANNLLGHIGSDDCSESLTTRACATRLRTAIDTYDDDLVLIFDAIEDAAPDATVVFMLAYNPFDLGLGTGLEMESNAVLEEFNGVARSLAEERGFRVADAYTAMAGTAAATTHMLDPTPDIHPLPIGFDILACTFVEALGQSC
jgi:lysophospholipase L1-like esterase